LKIDLGAREIRRRITSLAAIVTRPIPAAVRARRHLEHAFSPYTEREHRRYLFRWLACGTAAMRREALERRAEQDLPVVAASNDQIGNRFGLRRRAGAVHCGPNRWRHHGPEFQSRNRRRSSRPDSHRTWRRARSATCHRPCRHPCWLSTSRETLPVSRRVESRAHRQPGTRAPTMRREERCACISPLLAHPACPLPPPCSHEQLERRISHTTRGRCCRVARSKRSRRTTAGNAEI
jgi:hypothetical protein